MGTDVSKEVPPTEKAVEALLLRLVKPLLDLNQTEETPSESQQRVVAKWVYAAALLYNYYHLKQHTEEEFLGYEKFCELAIKFTPSIRRYMTPNLKDHENSLSLVDKAVMNACTVSKTFRDASSTIKEWPVTKVAVFLIDSKKENCFLLQEEEYWWSAVEKDLNLEGNGLESESEKVSTQYNAACSAVKELAGINCKLEVLENFIVSFPNQAKTATRFYIMQITESIRKDKLVPNPIKDAISCLQRPVIQKWSDIWVTTSAVQYYYLLPYAERLSEWFSRSEGDGNSAISKKKDYEQIMKDLRIDYKRKLKRYGEKKSGILTLHEDRKGMLVLDHGVAKTKPLQDFQFMDDAQRSKLSDTAMRALLNKKQKLSNQRPTMEDELNSCEKKIQEIRQSDTGDCLGLKLEAVLECCNEICQDLKAGTPPNGGKRKRRLPADKSVSSFQRKERKKQT